MVRDLRGKSITPARRLPWSELYERRTSGLGRFGCGVRGHPLRDRLAGPVVVVVQVQDHRSERQALPAAFGAAAQRVLEAVEEPLEVLRPDPGRVERKV